MAEETKPQTCEANSCKNPLDDYKGMILDRWTLNQEGLCLYFVEAKGNTAGKSLSVIPALRTWHQGINAYLDLRHGGFFFCKPHKEVEGNLDDTPTSTQGGHDE